MRSAVFLSVLVAVTALAAGGPATGRLRPVTALAGARPASAAGSIVYASTRRDGVLISSDGLASWRQGISGLTTRRFSNFGDGVAVNTILADPDDARILYIAG